MAFKADVWVLPYSAVKKWQTILDCALVEEQKIKVTHDLKGSLET